jgi:hypothetical protein
MAWNATLIDGPLRGKVVKVDDDEFHEPPPTLTVEGHHYLYCGFSDHMPRYRFHDEALATVRFPAASS